jgi:hypothetical protein
MRLVVVVLVVQQADREEHKLRMVVLVLQPNLVVSLLMEAGEELGEDLPVVLEVMEVLEVPEEQVKD